MYPHRPSAPHAFPTFAREKLRRLTRSARAVDEAAPSDASGRIDRRGLRGLRDDDDDERAWTVDDDDDDDARGRGQLKIIDTRAVPSIDLRCRGI